MIEFGNLWKVFKNRVNRILHSIGLRGEKMQLKNSQNNLTACFAIQVGVQIHFARLFSANPHLLTICFIQTIHPDSIGSISNSDPFLNAKKLVPSCKLPS